jgi:DeoR family transcriptional regulator, suf operon transcriptional repressor
MLRKQLLDSSRGRIVAILQRGGLTADEMASELELTATAVRAHITAMERDGVVQRTGRRSGTTRPSQVFELTPEVEQLLSGAYIPLLIELVRQFATRVEPKQLRDLMRGAGRALAATLSRSGIPDAPFAARVNGVSALLNEQFGSTMKVEKANGHYNLRGYGCPLAALTGSYPAVCLAIESLIAALLDTDVRECCDRSQRPQCCFDVAPPAPSQGPRETVRFKARKSDR